jgi:hypothetical protein
MIILNRILKRKLNLILIKHFCLIEYKKITVIILKMRGYNLWKIKKI